MHELGLTEEIVAAASEAGEGRQVTRIVLEIGKLSVVSPDAIRFCFALVAEGTAVSGAVLDIREIPGRARCRACSRELELDQPFGRCECGASDLEWLAGEELKIKELEVA
jgi:hydrogenase nickel incorporation protein HypA/HybF